MCQSCGHIGCCDNSPNRHATAHFNETGHPLIRSVEPGEDWSWCYVDELMFRLQGLTPLADETTGGAAAGRSHRLTATLREEARVTPLELFFDLVFVLALTQCTALMADDPTWEGLAKGMLVLGVMWWSWVGYAWLTSVVDPEEGARAAGDVRRDGRVPRRRAVRPGRVRRRGAAVRRAPTRSCASRRSACS